MYKNRITIIGNVSQEPTVRTTGSGVEVCNFSVATNHIFYRNEEKISQPEYHACSAWDRLVPRCENLRLGQKIEIEGRVKENNWEKTCSCGQTVKQYRYEIQVNSILYLDKKNEEA